MERINRKLGWDGKKQSLSLRQSSGYTLIKTAKMNCVDPLSWLTDVLGRIADHNITRLDELMPWRYAALAV